MYGYRNIEAHSWDYWFRGKSLSIAYSECVFVALVIRHAMRMRHIVICGVSGCTIFSHFISSKGAILKKEVMEHKMCVLIFYTTFARHVSIAKKN